MQKLSFLGLLIITLFIYNCKGTEASGKVNKTKPESVVKAFLSHLNKLEMDKAKEYGTENTHKILDLLSQVLAMAPEEDRKKMLEEAKKTKVENIKCNTTGDKSQCDYCCDEKGQRQAPLDLIKKDGKWYVDMKKSEPPADGEENHDGHNH